MSRRASSKVILLMSALLAPLAPAAAQDNATAARQEVRIQQLEGQIRELNGQIEELNFRVQQMTTRLDKLVADIDFRLRELEGGGAGMSESDAGSGSAPAATEQALPSEGQTSALDQSSGGGQTGTSQTGTGQTSGTGQPKVLGTLSQQQLDAQSKQLNTNADPAAASAAAGAAGTSADQGGEADTSQQAYALPGATPDEQYQYAFDLLRQNKYADAEQALRTFVDQNPDHPLAGNANYWLGETYYVRQDFQNAAITFADGSQRYPKSGKAPDSLLKLGMALAALGETNDACMAFAELTERYPNASGSVKQRASKEQAKNGCQ